MEADISKLATAEGRLREVIRGIVKRRRANGAALSWRLMFEIEDEAIAMLENDPALDMRYVNMMASPTAQRRVTCEERAGLSDLYAMHTALWMIQEAYYHAERDAHRPTA